MFSKNGDVAFYDSCANAYLKHKVDNYDHTEEAPGKVCFVLVRQENSLHAQTKTI